MSSQVFRLLEARTIAANEQSADDAVLDLGAYQTLVLDPRVLKTGSGGNIYLETSATGLFGSWRTVHSFPANSAADLYVVGAFLRFLRWRASNDIAGSPIVSIDGVAKGG